MLIGESMTLGIYLNTALHHERPGAQHAMRMRDRAVSLISTHVPQLHAERLAPRHDVALVPRVAKIESFCHLWNVLAHHCAVAAEAIAGEDQGMAAYFFAASIRS